MVSEIGLFAPQPFGSKIKGVASLSSSYFLDLNRVPTNLPHWLSSHHKEDFTALYTWKLSSNFSFLANNVFCKGWENQKFNWYECVTDDESTRSEQSREDRWGFNGHAMGASGDKPTKMLVDFLKKIRDENKQNNAQDWRWLNTPQTPPFLQNCPIE